MLSVVVNTKNAAETLKGSLESVKDFADEIVVVDMKSSDDTVVLAKKYTKKVFAYERDLGFADPARNFALSKATGDWVLVLDADEEITSDLKEKLRGIMSSEKDDVIAYFLPRKNMIFGKWIAHTGWWPDYQLRFFKKGTVSWTEKVHTSPVAIGKTAVLPAQESLAIVHHNYQRISQFVDRLNRYTTVQSQQKFSEKSEQEFSSANIIKSFANEFFRRMFVQDGLLDGQHGVSLSFLQAMYEQIVFLKKWEQAGFVDSKRNSDPAATVKALREFQNDLNYWLADWQVKHARGASYIVWKIRRRLKW
jgi:glycosyltransferase involved in cell wall biosynthesis